MKLELYDLKKDDLISFAEMLALPLGAIFIDNNDVMGYILTVLYVDGFRGGVIPHLAIQLLQGTEADTEDNLPLTIV